MLNWLVGSKADHPLANDRQARALIAELPAGDHVQALNEITRWLESLGTAQGFKLDRLVEVAGLLDAAAKTHHRKLIGDYIPLTRQRKARESRLWTCGASFAKALGDTYAMCVKRYREGAPGSGALRKQVPALIARAMRATGSQLKWSMGRYGPFEARIWQVMSELYNYAEAEAFHAEQVQIYPGAHGKGTIDEEWLKVMMLWGSSADGLTPIGQEIAERMIAQVAGEFRIGKTSFPGATHCFDGAGGKPPARLAGGDSEAPGTLYYGPGDARSRVLEFAATIEKSNEVSADLILSATYQAEVVLPILQHLALNWSAQPPARKSERRVTSTRITVVPGFLGLLEMLALEGEGAPDFAASKAESWVVDDMSDGGYGAIVPTAAIEWIQVGELVGVQVEGESRWGAGLVRRVVRDEQRRYHVGIEIISRMVFRVQLAHGHGAPGHEDAMLLSRQPDDAAQMGVLLRAGRYDPKATAEMAGASGPYLFTPARMMDAGDDFDRAVYTISEPAS